MNVKRFTDLAVWKKARELRKEISTLTKLFPMEEKYDLISQVKRFSRSVTADIAEGYGRFHYQESIQFCRITRDSLTETLDHLIVAFNEGYTNEFKLNYFEVKPEERLKILNGYINYFKIAKSSTNN